MKSIRGNKAAAWAAVLISLASCTYRPEAALPAGSWQFTDVSRADTTLFELTEEDRLSLNRDSSFTYFLQTAGKPMKGRWTYSEHTLHLNFTEADTLRHFEAIIISDKKMVLKEGDVQFKLSRTD